MKKAVIIGAGIAGLSAGINALKFGLEAEIYEMHSLPGGLCTSWKRKGYFFDGCIHWLIGINERSPFHKYWEDLGVFEDQKYVLWDEFATFDTGEKKIHIFSDIEKLENHLYENFPSDIEKIKELIKRISLFTKTFFAMEKPPEDYRLFDGLKVLLANLPYLSKIRESQIKNLDNFFNGSSREFSEIFKSIIGGKFPSLALFSTLASYNQKDAGWPVGGSLKFARKIESKFLKMGGKIFYSKKADKIKVKNDTAVGVRFEDGDEITADYIISTANAHKTIYGFLEGKYSNERIDGIFKYSPTSETSVQISVGVNASLSENPVNLFKKLKSPIDAGGKFSEYLMFKNFSFDKTLNTEHRTSITSVLSASYDYWKSLYSDKDRYLAEKNRIAERVTEELENTFPEAKGKIDTFDVATPVTYERYTGAWKGIYMGFAGSKDSSLPLSLPRLKNLYMAGQFMLPNGGLPVALISGMWCIRKIIRN